MILNASADSGSSTVGLRIRTVDSSPGLWPSMPSMSSGEGRKSTTASSMGCTPLFLNAVPVRAPG